MPLYTYRCPSCRGRLEETRSIERRHDAPQCPVCSSGMLLAPTAPAMINTTGQPTGGRKRDGTGGPDQMTADLLGIPVKDIPPGLRSDG